MINQIIVIKYTLVKGIFTSLGPVIVFVSDTYVTKKYNLFVEKKVW